MPAHDHDQPLPTLMGYYDTARLSLHVRCWHCGTTAWHLAPGLRPGTVIDRGTHCTRRDCPTRPVGYLIQVSQFTLAEANQRWGGPKAV
ncbi:hypothetical protein [Streptomyces palmae]|uniref:Uncharacterized protein n=1 Tax=Streptomyces palmae TaxID=1701085 RepID=A0A4Z0H7V3_9ACTN|nr:hypothetical protein [Streptomyces palmae]TGB10832.1 hypothetical protein E4099_12530 [Streptomyces palmae]